MEQFGETAGRVTDTEAGRAEALTPERFEERVAELGQLHTCQREEGDSAADVLDKLRGRGSAIGFSEDAVAAAYAPEGDYQNYLQGLARNDSDLLVSYPELLAPLFESGERKALYDHALRYSNNAGAGVDTDFVAYLEPDQRRHYAERALSGNRKLFPGQLAVLHRYGLAGSELLREKARHSLARDELFWQPLSTKYRGSPENMAERGCEDVRYLIGNGILSEEEVSHNLAARESGNYFSGQSFAVRQYEQEAFLASALLGTYGVLEEPAHKQAWRDNLPATIRNHARSEGANLYSEVFLRKLHDLDLVSGEECVAQLQSQWQTLDYGSKVWLANPAERQLGDTGLATAACRELACETSENEDFAWDYTTVELIFDTNVTDPAVKKQLLETYLQSTQVNIFSISDAMAAFGELYADEPEKRREITRAEFARVDEYRLAMCDWRLWAEYGELSPETIRQRHTELMANGDVTVVADLAAGAKHSDEPLMPADVYADAAVDYLRNYDGDERQFDPFKHLYRSFALGFGRDGVAVLEQKLLEALPPERLVEIIREDGVGDYSSALGEFVDGAAGGDYYTRLELLFSIDKWAGRTSPDRLEEHIGWGLEDLSSLDLVEAGHHMWPYLNDGQKERVCGAALSNPAEKETWLEVPEFLALFRETKLSRALEAPEAQDEESLCPKIDKTLARRLHGKHTAQARQKVLSQYSYHYDLAKRVGQERLRGSANELMRHFRGHKDEKAELRTMELLHLLSQNEDVDAETILLMDAPEAALQAWEATAGQFGLSGVRSRELAGRLEGENVDIVKFGMWLDASRKSSGLTEYFKNYLAFRASGRSHADWKFANPLADVSVIGQKNAAVWQQEISETVRAGGQAYNVRLTHGLDAVYQAGARPNYNCLHYAYGMNQHALAGLFDPAVKMLHIENAKGKPVANAVLHLGRSNEDGRLVLAQEPWYESANDTVAERGLAVASAEIIYRHASKLGANGVSMLSPPQQEAYRRLIDPRFELQPSETVTIPKGLAPYSYTDARGIGRQALRVSAAPLAKEAFSIIYLA